MNSIVPAYRGSLKRLELWLIFYETLLQVLQQSATRGYKCFKVSQTPNSLAISSGEANASFNKLGILKSESFHYSKSPGYFKCDYRGDGSWYILLASEPRQDTSTIWSECDFGQPFPLCTWSFMLKDEQFLCSDCHKVVQEPDYFGDSWQETIRIKRSMLDSQFHYWELYRKWEPPLYSSPMSKSIED